MAAPNFPAWVPIAVVCEARRILAKTDDPELVLRLATDHRMKRVWAELSKIDWASVELDDLWLSIRPPLDEQLTKQETAFTVIFWYAYIHAYIQPSLITISELDVLLASCEQTAKQLRNAATILSALPTKLSGSDYLTAGGMRHQVAENHAREIEEAAAFCDAAVAVIIELKAFEGINPRVVDRPGQYRTERSYVRHLAASIGTAGLYGTCATIASVALDSQITKEQVIEWTRWGWGPLRLPLTRLPSPAISAIVMLSTEAARHGTSKQKQDLPLKAVAREAI
jgi:hypothetical protein